MNASTVDLDKNSRFHIASFVAVAAERVALEVAMNRNLAVLTADGGCRGLLVFEKVGDATTLDVVAIVGWESGEAFENGSGKIADFYRELGIDAPSLPSRFTAFVLVDVPTTLGLANGSTLHYWIDSFFIPKSSREPFEEARRRSRAFIETRAGCRGHLVFEREAGPATLNVISIAAWENQDVFERASEAIRAHEEESGFTAAAVLAKWGVRVEIGNYKRL